MNTPIAEALERLALTLVEHVGTGHHLRTVTVSPEMFRRLLGELAPFMVVGRATYDPPSVIRFGVHAGYLTITTLELTRVVDLYRTRSDRRLGCHSVDGHGMSGVCDCHDLELRKALAVLDGVPS